MIPPFSPGESAGTTRPFFSDPWTYCLLACFLLAFLFGNRLINDADMGFHLKCGQWMFQNHRVPTADTFTYTVPGREYLDMEWLYQGALYLGYQIGGYPLISLGHTGLALLAFFLLWRRLKTTGLAEGPLLLFFAAALLASENRFRARPEILTWVLLGLTLWILENKNGRGRKWLLLLPFLQWLWVNTEGLFFLGLVAMGAFCLSDWFHTGRPDPRLLKFSGWSLAACLLNPHSFQGLFFPLAFLSHLGSSEIYRYTVMEFQRPWALAGGAAPPFLALYKAFSLFLLFLFLATFRLRKFHEWVLALFFFALSFAAARNIPLFLLAAAPLAAAAGRDWVGGRRLARLFSFPNLAAGVLALFLLGFGLRVVTGAHYVSHRLTDRFGLGLDAKALPVGACEFLNRNHLEGRILNTLDFGDWLDWQGPQKTFIDGRLDVMGLDLFTEYNRALFPGGLDGLLVKYGPDILFFNPRLAPQWMVDLRDKKNWRLVYLDGVAAVFLRKGYGDALPDLDFGKLLADQGLAPALLSRPEEILSAPPPPRWVSFLGDFIRPAEDEPGLLNLGIACGNLGRWGESEMLFLEGIRRTKGRYGDYFYNLGLLYGYEGKRGLAELCRKRF